MSDETEDLDTFIKRHVSTTVYASKEQMAALRAMSKKTGVPMAVYIRRGIDLILKEIGEKVR